MSTNLCRTWCTASGGPWLRLLSEMPVTIKLFVLTAGLALVVVSSTRLAGTQAPPTPRERLTRPGFHHIHMNSVNPSAAIEEFLRVYPGSTRVTVAGFEGLRSANDVTLLFTKVNAPPPAPGPDRITVHTLQTAFWHHVWSVQNARSVLAQLRTRYPAFDSERFIPQYTGPQGDKVDFSSDTLSGFLTTSQLEEARRKGLTPTHTGGYFNWYGPDGVVMETAEQGGLEAYRIIGMFQEQPYCAVIWYREHLLAAESPASGRGGADGRGGASGSAARPTSEGDCRVSRGADVSWPSTYRRGHYRIPPAQSVYFDDVQLRWYMNQEDRPLASTRGQLMDHIAVRVTDLDAWIGKLQNEDVKFLEQPYRFGSSRAVMIEGPGREALELVETK
jgi:hypothetical protein